MVLQRTIENLRERPHDERRAVALLGSVVAMAVLFVGWAAFFFQGVDISQVNQASGVYNDAVANVQEAYTQSQTGWVSEASPENTQTIVPAEEYGTMQLIEETPPIDPAMQ